MTMPKGWPEPKPKEKELTEVEKREKEELDKILDFYYEVVKPAENDPNVSEKDRKKVRAQYWKMKNAKEAQIIARKIGIQEGEVKTMKDLEKNKVFKKNRKELQKLNKIDYRKLGISSSSSSSDSDAGAAILIGCFVVGVILLIVTVFTLNFYVLALGGVLFLIGVAGLSWGGRGSHDNTSGFFWYTYGSHNAKKNMWRGHKYSRKR